MNTDFVLAVSDRSTDALNVMFNSPVGRDYLAGRHGIDRTLLDRLPEKRGKVKKVFIHLEKRTPPEQFEPFAPLVAPVRDGFQLGLALFALGLVDEDTVRQCREAVSAGSQEPDADLDALIKDAVRRRLISRQKLRRLYPSI